MKITLELDADIQRISTDNVMQLIKRAADLMEEDLNKAVNFDRSHVFVQGRGTETDHGDRYLQFSIKVSR